MPSRLRRSFVAIALTLAGACSGDGAPMPHEPSTPGQLAFTVGRSANSQVPAAADSALIRVWNPSTGFNKVWPLAIPAVGTTTSLELTVPSGTGYRVGVVAYTAPQASFRHALAAGIVADVAVAPSEPTPVTLTVAPWTYAIVGLDTAQSGQQVTYALEITSGPVDDIFADFGKLNLGLAPDIITTDLLLSRSGSAMSATFNVPTVAADTAMYFRYAIYLDQGAWQSNAVSFTADFPAVETGHAPFRVPVTVPGGTITVSF